MVQTAARTRSDSRRAEILRRAADLFRRKGFHGAGMREIAQGLEMAPGALYYYFASKEDLLHACQTIALRMLLESARAIVASTATPEVRLRHLILAHLQHVLGELGGSLAHIEFHSLPETLLREVVEQRDAYERIVRRILREGVRTGVFRKMDVKFVALSLLGALNWTVVWWRPGGGRKIGDLARQMSETFLEGLHA